MKTSPKSILLFVFVIIYNYFFWKESFGINLLIFSMALGAALVYVYPGSVKSINVRISFIGSILSAFFVFVYNTDYAKVIHLISFAIFTGFVHETQLRTVYNSLLSYLNNLILLPMWFARKPNTEPTGVPTRSFSFSKTLRLSFVPFLVLLVFYFIYRAANPVFRELSNDFFDNFFQFISFERLMFIVLGFIIIASVLYQTTKNYLLSFESKHPIQLSRIRSGTKPDNILGLKNEHRSGIILLLLVNALLAIVNIIDIRYIWFGFDLIPGMSLKEFVHEGVYLLIFSILLSMGILIHLFRSSQNFYPLKTPLKTLAYVWIAQNAILTVSVLLRNYYYIDYHGLAYKRIGVIIFLLLVVFGLITMFFKVKNKYSSFYLWKINSWAAYILLIMASAINWDVWIVKHNLNHKNAGDIDIDFYYTASDNALPVIYENLEKVKNQMEAHKFNKIRWVEHLDFIQFKSQIQIRRETFLKRSKELTWLSYSIQRNKTKAYLTEHANIQSGRSEDQPAWKYSQTGYDRRSWLLIKVAGC